MRFLKIRLFSLFFSLCAVSGSLTDTKAQLYANLALEGGGIRGIAYAGAVEVLQQHRILDSIHNIAGTSVGAVVGSLLSVGYTSEEIKARMFELRVQTFNDGRWFFLGGEHRMLHQFGWYRGDALERWIDNCLTEKAGKEKLTFRQLHELAMRDRRFKDLFVTGSDLSRQQLTIFCWKTFPDMEVATAVRASMSVPLYFRALSLDSNGRKTSTDNGDIYVDGGLVMNYPLGLFDSGSVNMRTLGLKLERPEQMKHFHQSTTIAPYPITNFSTYVGALYNLTIETLNRKMRMEDEGARTIYISTEGMNPKVRRITKRQKEILYESGRRAAAAFFAKR